MSIVDVLLPVDGNSPTGGATGPSDSTACVVLGPSGGSDCASVVEVTVLGTVVTVVDVSVVGTVVTVVEVTVVTVVEVSTGGSHAALPSEVPWAAITSPYQTVIVSPLTTSVTDATSSTGPASVT